MSYPAPNAWIATSRPSGSGKDPTKRLRQRVVAAIRALANDPRPAGCVKLTGADKYRLRTGRYRILYTVRTGRYRILYTVRDAEVILTIVRVAHRSDAYR